MTKQKSTKRALLMSALSLLLCVSMLVGSTFAWFTDEVKSGTNIIAAGNLDVELTHTNKAVTDEKVRENIKLFTDVKLWEPGAVAYEKLTVSNVGDLALKYNLAINITNANGVEDADGVVHTLAEVLKVAVVDPDALTSREAAIAAGNEKWKPMGSWSEIGMLYPKNDTTGANSDTYGIVIYWEPTDNDNLFNMNNGKKTTDGGDQLTIDLGVHLAATQLMYEKDSFDETYDKDTEVYTVAEANAMLKENKDVTLVNCIEANGVIQIPAAYTGKLILKNSTIASVQAEAAANITVLGDVTVDASALTDTSAITGTVLNINGNGNLTAIASGKHAYGIGGDKTTAITIDGVHIVDAKGGYVQPSFINDTGYGTSEPEGGAAIGSGYSGAVITLNNVTVDNAQGGSKAAGIGARFWTGVTVNINNSVIKNVEGGNASAGIGGSRVSDDVAPAEQHVKINIKNSSINATGGQFGAGIGSGYDTHCGEKDNEPFITETICTINIDAASDITAQGGKYAAGVGTGYHVAALAGNIECKVNATAGESREKYTIAQAVGFGVVDHDREVAALATAPSITYQGTVITVPGAQVTSSDALAAAINAGETEIYLAAGNFTLPSVKGKNITLIGAGTGTVVDYSQMGGYQEVSGSSFNFKNMTVKNVEAGYPYKGLQHITSVSYENCHITGTVNLFAPATFTNCTFDSKSAEHCVVTYGSDSVTFTNCAFTYGDRAVNCYAEDAATRDVKVTFNNCTFTKVAGKDTIGAIETNSCFMNSLTLTVNDCTINEGELVFISAYDTLAGSKSNITVDDAETYVITVGNPWTDNASDAAVLEKALSSDAKNIKVILLEDLAIDIGCYWNMGGTNTESITIDGNGKTMTLSDTYRSYFYLANANGKLYLNNMTLKSSHSGTHFFDYSTHFNCDVDATNVDFKAAPLVNAGATAKFTDCTFNEDITNGYGLWVMSGSDVTVYGGAVNSDRGIKIADEDSAAETTVLNVSGTKFNTDAKAAILVATKYGATVTVDNVDITNCAADKTNAVWVDSDWTDYADTITVTGATCINEP